MQVKMMLLELQNIKTRNIYFQKFPLSHCQGGKWKGRQGKKGKREKKKIKAKGEKTKGFLKYEEKMKMAKGDIKCLALKDYVGKP